MTPAVLWILASAKIGGEAGKSQFALVERKCKYHDLKVSYCLAWIDKSKPERRGICQSRESV